jgi:hypothetical protein
MDILDRFLAKVVMFGEDDHHLWTGARCGSKGQYGAFSYEGKLQPSHRVIWKMTVGPIPAGLTIDHLCKVTLCQNVDHMELVTRGENSLRGDGPAGLNSRKTECPRGHPYDDKNTIIDRHGHRACRLCFNAKVLRRYYRRKAQRKLGQ